MSHWWRARGQRRNAGPLECRAFPTWEIWAAHSKGCAFAFKGLAKSFFSVFYVCVWLSFCWKESGKNARKALSFWFCDGYGCVLCLVCRCMSWRELLYTITVNSQQGRVGSGRWVGPIWYRRLCGNEGLLNRRCGTAAAGAREEDGPCRKRDDITLMDRWQSPAIAF